MLFSESKRNRLLITFFFLVACLVLRYKNPVFSLFICISVKITTLTSTLTFVSQKLKREKGYSDETWYKLALRDDNRQQYPYLTSICISWFTYFVNLRGATWPLAEFLCIFCRSIFFPGVQTLLKSVKIKLF